MNDKTVEYPYCKVAYKENDSLGWKLAIMDGDKETVNEKCKQFNWFDYIVFIAGSHYDKQIKDNFNYYPDPDDVHLLSHWIYWQDIDRWFVKEDEVIPYPLKNCEETDKIQFSYYFDYDDVDASDFDCNEPIYVSAEVEFETKTQKAEATIEITILYDNFENFITNLKTKKFGACHIEEFTNYKLLAWEKEDKVRFMIQNYNGYNENNEYIPIDFDVLVNKDIFYKYFEEFYNSLKIESKKLLQEMTEEAYSTHKKYKKVNIDYKWQYLEFKKHSDLWNYIQSIKPLLVGESIGKILFNPDYFNYGEENPKEICGYNLEKVNEDVELSSHRPIILEIGEHKLILNMDYGSWLEISLDKELIVKEKDIALYYDVSKLFSKNIIGRKITDIKIETISRYDAQASDTLYPRKILSDDMFQSLVIELDSGYSLVNSCDSTVSTISEIKI